MALGLSMIYGILRILHVAHGAVFALGPFLVLAILAVTGQPWVAAGSAGLLGGLVGAAIFLPLYRPVLSAPRFVPLVISIGALILLQEVYRLIWGPVTLPFPRLMTPQVLRFGPLVLTNQQVAVIVAATMLLVLAWLLLYRTKLGLAWRALASDLEMASAFGIPVPRIVALNFFVASVLAAAAGIAVGMYYGEVFPTMGATAISKGFIVIVLGGLGNLPGAVAASFMLAALETVLVATVGFVLPRDAIAFLSMILVLLVKPAGLFGREARA